ncbi:hypothetical protein [Streptomyces sp. CS207]|uniref:hypothetical protein n=1 Tax=Streptomyces sp. CS207 TaxID=2162712 RepID=UPI0013A5B374
MQEVGDAPVDLLALRRQPFDEGGGGPAVDDTRQQLGVRALPDPAAAARTSAAGPMRTGRRSGPGVAAVGEEFGAGDEPAEPRAHAVVMEPTEDAVQAAPEAH